VELPLLAGRGLAAQPELLGVLGGVHLPEDGLDDRLSPRVDRVPVLALGLVRHLLLGRRVGGDRIVQR
jgi:hypothetical protein